MSEELKSCPFCGARAVGDLFDGPLGVYASCSNKNCGMNNVGIPATLWNTRQTPEGYALLSINDILSLTFSFDSRHRLEAMIASAQEETE